LPCDLEALLVRACWGIGCHGNNTPGANLDLQTPGVQARLVDVPATHLHILPESDTYYCDPSELLVDAENPDESLMLTKVIGTHSCGAAMPIKPDTISSDEIVCLRQWIWRLAGKEAPTDDWPAAGGNGGGGS
jgi:hypothetical protein